MGVGRKNREEILRGKVVTCDSLSSMNIISLRTSQSTKIASASRRDISYIMFNIWKEILSFETLITHSTYSTETTDRGRLNKRVYGLDCSCLSH